MIEALHDSQNGARNELLGVQKYDEQGIDVVAVHGLNENSETAWTNAKTKQNWLRHLLPKDLPAARILTFDYRAESSAYSFFEESGLASVERVAQTLVQNLNNYRELEGGSRRPIVFVCHGIGGVVVKQALLYSSRQTSARVQHLHSVFVSTFGLVLFGVPHKELNPQIWLDLDTIHRKQHAFSTSNAKNTATIRNAMPEGLRDLESPFANIADQFYMLFLWEESKTRLRNRECFIVDKASAAPTLDNTDRTGIPTDHVSLVKFPHDRCAAYRAVLTSLRRYCEEAPLIISHRWALAEQNLRRARSSKAFELTGVKYTLPEEDNRMPYGRQQNGNNFEAYINLPRRPEPKCVGRERVLLEIETAFFRSDLESQKVYVLYGMGGAGKTEIAIRFANDNRHRFSSIFTIDASDPNKVATSFASIAKIGGLEATEKSGKHFLAHISREWLLLIDNADDSMLNLPDLFPSCDAGNILVTTRVSDFRKYGTVGSKHIGGLAQGDAIQLFFNSAQISGPPWLSDQETIVMKIAHALGYLALALKAAGMAIFRKVCRINDYLDYHRHHCDRYRSSSSSSSSSASGVRILDDEARIYSVFDVSAKWLEEKPSVENHDALQLLSLLAFYHYERIAVSIFDRAIQNRNSSYNVQSQSKDNALIRLLSLAKRRMIPPRALPDFMKLENIESQKWRLKEATARLNSLSLIIYDDIEGMVSLHPLVHAWARSRLAPGTRKLWARVALNLLTESIALPEANSPTTKDQTRYHRSILPHLDVCWKEFPLEVNIHGMLLVPRVSKFLPILMPTLLLNTLSAALDTAKYGYVQLDCGCFEDAVGLFSQVNTILTSVLGPENERTMRVQLVLGRACWGLGRLDEAIELQTHVSNTKEKTLGPTHRETLVAKDHLAKSYWLNGQYREALNIQRTTTRLMRQTVDPYDSDLLAASDNFGVILGAWHRFTESLAEHEQTLRVREKKFGLSAPETVDTRMYRAMALLDLKRLEESLDEMTKVYESRKLHLGKEHPWTLWALCYLAKVQVKLGHLNEAEHLLREGIAAGKRSLSDDHLGVLMGCGELARVYSRQNRFEDALVLLKDTVERLGKSRGEQHPDHVYATWKLAQLHKKRGDDIEARRLCRKALELAETRLTETHPIFKMICADLESLEGAEPSPVREDSAAEARKRPTLMVSKTF